MAYSILIESWHEFHEKHGGRPLSVGGRLVYADGASVHPDDRDHRAAPPSDPIELVRVKLRYWQEAVRRSTADFHALRGRCSQQAELCSRYGNLPGPSNEALSSLHRLKDAVQFCREKVSELEKELASKVGTDPAADRRKFMVEQELQQRSRAAELAHEISSITI